MERHNHPILTTAIIAAIALSLPLAFAAPISDNGEPKAANKTAAASGDTIDLDSDLSDGLTESGVTVLETFIKSSKTQDLILSVSLECALWTEVISTTLEDHEAGYGSFASAEARVEIWIEIDGTPITMGDSDGRVTFCDRVHEQEITDLDDENNTTNFTLRQRLETINANAFNWAVVDVGSGMHHIAVKADIEADNTEGSYADGAVGFRTLIVEPTRFPTGTVL